MNGIDYEVPHCGAFSILHSHPSWAQIFKPERADIKIIHLRAIIINEGPKLERSSTQGLYEGQGEKF